MFLLFVFLTLLSAFQRTDTASQQATTKAITEIEQRYTAALVKKDHVVFDELLADDLLHILVRPGAAS